MNSTKKSALVWLTCVVATGGVLSACGSDSKADTPIDTPAAGVGGASANGTGGSAGGTGGAAGTAGGNVGGAAGSSAAGAGGSSAGGTAGAGGASTGGSGGSGGAAGSGTGGSGGADACLDASTFASAITLSLGLPFCVVGAYTTDSSVQFAGPSWGSHGGPLTASSTATGVSICRWQLPSGATGAATCEKHDAAPPNLPKGMIFFGTTLDVPFLNGTLLSYTSTDAQSSGEVLLYSPTLDTLNDRANVNGFFSAVGLTGATASRLVYTGLSPLGTAPSMTSEGGVYVAPACAGKIAPSGSCAAAKKVATWQMSSGPVAADTEGAVFATLSTFGGSQEIHGFAKDLLLTSDTPGNGDMILTDMNYTTSLAAVPPGATHEEGYVFIAEGDPMTGGALPILAVKYGSSDHVVAGATLKDTITTVPPMGSPSLFADDKGHFWIAIDTGASAGMLLELKHK